MLSPVSITIDTPRLTLRRQGIASTIHSVFRLASWASAISVDVVIVTSLVFSVLVCARVCGIWMTIRETMTAHPSKSLGHLFQRMVALLDSSCIYSQSQLLARSGDERCNVSGVNANQQWSRTVHPRA